MSIKIYVNWAGGVLKYNDVKYDMTLLKHRPIINPITTTFYGGKDCVLYVSNYGDMMRAFPLFISSYNTAYFALKESM